MQFYKNLFGFEIKKEQPEDKSKIIGNNKIKLCLYEDPEMKPDGAIVHFGFHVENFDEIMELCKLQGVKIYYDALFNLKNHDQFTLAIPTDMT